MTLAALQEGEGICIYLVFNGHWKLSLGLMQLENKDDQSLPLTADMKNAPS
jgi:hypothetical protein